MAQRVFNQFPVNTRSARFQTTRAPGFRGGSVDPVSGNFVPAGTLETFGARATPLQIAEQAGGDLAARTGIAEAAPELKRNPLEDVIADGSQQGAPVSDGGASSAPGGAPGAPGAGFAEAEAAPDTTSLSDTRNSIADSLNSVGIGPRTAQALGMIGVTVATANPMLGLVAGQIAKEAATPAKAPGAGAQNQGAPVGGFNAAGFNNANLGMPGGFTPGVNAPGFSPKGFNAANLGVPGSQAESTEEGPGAAISATQADDDATAGRAAATGDEASDPGPGSTAASNGEGPGEGGSAPGSDPGPGSAAASNGEGPGEGGSDTGGGNDSGGGDGYFRGGVVTPDRLHGPNPTGPDQGYAALQSGETVMNREATDKFGPMLQQMNQSSAGCFITEAVMASGGQQSDPDPLVVLRAFRDQIMMTTPEGQQMVQQYEQLAPMVVDAISQRPDAMQVFQQLYSSYIAPAVEMIAAGDMAGALGLYSQMISEVSALAAECASADYGEGDPNADPSAIDGMEQFSTDGASMAHDPVAQGRVTGMLPIAGEEPNMALGDDSGGDQEEAPDYPTPIRYARRM